MTRPGRHRKSGLREPNGRIQRPAAAKQAAEMRATVLEARARVHGLTAAQAEAMPETTVLGRLRVKGLVTQRQYDAGARYRDIVREYDRMMLARPLPSAGDLHRSSGHDDGDGTEPDYVRRFVRARAAWIDAHATLIVAEAVFPGSVVQAVVLGDWEPTTATAIAALGLALDALADTLRLPA